MTPRDVAALLARVKSNIHHESGCPWFLTTDDSGCTCGTRPALEAITELATALRAALADQRRYQWLRASGLVVLDESVTVEGDETVYPGIIADSYVDKVCDAAVTADGGGV